MSGTSELVFTLSKEAVKMVKNGTAMLSSGGVRSLSGELLELAKPASSGLSKVASFLSGGPFSIAQSSVSMASALASNVQCAIIQKGVDAANIKLDNVVKQLSGLSQSLQAVQTLSWVTSAFSLANCGISAAGFYMTIKRLDGINGQLKAFYDRYCSDRQDDIVKAFQTYILKFKNDLGTLKNWRTNSTFDDSYFETHSPSIAEHISETIPYIRSVIKGFRERKIEGQIACQIVFTLSAALFQTVNEFSCQYFYVHGIQHPMYGEWFSFIEEINSPDFHAAVRNHITFSPTYARMTPGSRKAIETIAFEGVTEQKSRLETCATTIHLMPGEKYLSMDELLNTALHREFDMIAVKKTGNDTSMCLTNQIMTHSIPAEADDSDLLAIPADFLYA